MPVSVSIVSVLCVIDVLLVMLAIYFVQSLFFLCVLLYSNSVAQYASANVLCLTISFPVADFVEPLFYDDEIG